MGKLSKREAVGVTSGLPLAPVVYVNDPFANMPHTIQLCDMIASSTIVYLAKVDMPRGFPVQGRDKVASEIRNGAFDKNITIINENYIDSQTKDKIDTVNLLREEAIKHGCNFVSVNLYVNKGTQKEDISKWGTNHLDCCIGDMTPKQVAERIQKFLFKVLTVQETLHLMSDSEMRTDEAKTYPDYQYRAINESKLCSQDAKVYFVALVVSKPVVGPNQKVTWTVADKTGLATFYFHYRGPACQHTWDWVMGLQPGERRTFPRMPMVKVKERKTVRVMKAPFRTVGFAVQGAGLAVRAVGHGVAKLGELGRLGKGSEWVPEADVVNGKKVDWPAVFKKEGEAKDAKLAKAIEAQKKAVDEAEADEIFNEKADKVWKDDDSAASTTGGDCFVDTDEKVREFC
ncbi:hypothetical protein A1O1_06763 [Capronia coronata CBS 617.96]|uniref:Uncharacterized protein n=1 Tax=Capronia coronata CBS 617.96 TaxID=1182541 RepID=W9YLJ5_9EURO|nr:uncharacterized protein A1O1_06763 [Capronia coronata CBS 617.96]EXJ83144.1 hypothetical protein A1O1_06763 [Capronia coronata CBS 617.96]